MTETMGLSLRRARSWLLSLSRKQKTGLQLFLDLGLIWLALWMSFLARLDFPSVFSPFVYYPSVFLIATLITLPILVRFGLYRTIMRYLGRQALTTTVWALTVSALLLAIIVYLYDISAHVIPRSIIIIYWMFSLFLVGGIRVGIRYFLSGTGAHRSSTKAALIDATGTKSHQFVLIYGAGAAGKQLLSALRASREMIAIAFIDDDADLVGRTVAGLKIYASTAIPLLLDKSRINEVLLAIPSATRNRRNHIVELLSRYPVQVRTVPGMMDLASGRVQVADLRAVDIADLLGRAMVEPNIALLKRCIQDSVVMVTGAGGSIGSELCRQIIHQGPTAILLYEHSEFNLYKIHSELTDIIENANINVDVIPLLGSVCNETKLTDVMRTWKVDTVYHAAAYKHVPMVEGNIAEGIINNTFGTLFSAQSAIIAGVKNFVLISTDKAVRPTNFMGASKRLSELVLQALADQRRVRLYGSKARLMSNRTRFTMVRFGNVLGSSGSVIPLFHSQIEKGGPVTVTHPEITRYFMTTLEAAQLVIQAGSLGEGGDVFVLNMGEAVKIVDLAEKMILLSGLSVRNANNIEGDIAIQYTGLRPGEKLYEELLIGNNVVQTLHPMIMRASEPYEAWPVFKTALSKLEAAIRVHDYVAVRSLLSSLVDGFQPDEEIVDCIYSRRAEHNEPISEVRNNSWVTPGITHTVTIPDGQLHSTA